MADITMCMGGKCPRKDKCWRYKAPRDEYWQSFFHEVPYEKYCECSHYWPIGGDDDGHKKAD